ncbi:MAG: hypothetical protein DYG88_02115 [Chloroflexi bacterium CFX4]|nr:hypothetical protein [Chloroflexi bacterium CFX4]MDL1922447.1 hypothetical protein [Chloroflexi bacterium CFX3]
MARLWQVLRLAFFAILGGGLALSAALALGLADPPRYGRLYAEVQDAATVPLPEGNFTLIALGKWSETASPLDAWHVVFEAADGTAVFMLSLHGDASFSVAPLQPDAVGFIHLRRPPEANEVYLHLTADGAEVRLNREIAWRGALPAAERVRISGGAVLRAADLRVFVP